MGGTTNWSALLGARSSRQLPTTLREGFHLPRRFPSGRGIFLRGDARPGFDLSQMSCGGLLLLLRLWHPRGGHRAPAHHSPPSRAPCAGALYALVSLRAAAPVRQVRVEVA